MTLYFTPRPPRGSAPGPHWVTSVPPDLLTQFDIPNYQILENTLIMPRATLHGRMHKKLKYSWTKNIQCSGYTSRTEAPAADVREEI